MTDHHLIAGVQQGKTAGAIRGFQHAGGKTCLPDSGRLLIACHAKDRNFAAKQIGTGGAEIGSTIAHLWQNFHGHAHQRTDIGVPFPGFDVVKHGARGIGGVGGMGATAGQFPDQKTVHGAKRQGATFCAVARAGNGIEQPFHFGGGKIGVEQQSGAGRDHCGMAVFLQRGTDIGSAAVLPDDGVMDRLAGTAIPDQSGFALIGDADGGDINRCQPRLFNRRARSSRNRSPQISRVMFNPTRSREMLRKFFLRLCHHSQMSIENNGARRGCALVDGKDMGHFWPIGRGNSGAKIGIWKR